MSWAKQRVPFLDDDDGEEENDVQDDVDSPVPTRPLVIDEDAEPAAGTSGGLEGEVVTTRTVKTDTRYPILTTICYYSSSRCCRASTICCCPLWTRA